MYHMHKGKRSGLSTGAIAAVAAVVSGVVLFLVGCAFGTFVAYCVNRRHSLTPNNNLKSAMSI